MYVCMYIYVCVSFYVFFSFFLLVLAAVVVFRCFSIILILIYRSYVICTAHSLVSHTLKMLLQRFTFVWFWNGNKLNWINWLVTLFDCIVHAQKFQYYLMDCTTIVSHWIWHEGSVVFIKSILELSDEHFFSLFMVARRLASLDGLAVPS